MSVNKFMHPRNIYKKPPDFVQLALNYPEFKSISIVKLNGKVTIDFTNSNAIRILTRCLLLKDFELDVELPQNKLVPTLPLRFNYILWIEDLIESLRLNDVYGVDIGCGASCIYPLLGAKSKSWNMIGLECDEDSVKVAQRNVDTNNLTASIQIIKTDGSSDIFSVLDKTIEYTFCMCNPPFYNFDSTEGKINRTGNRKPPKNGLTGISNELYTIGGEVTFATKIITESLHIRNRFKIYTTMLGHKSSVNKLIDVLMSNEINNYAKTEFCQGNTTRWGLAWSFDESINLITKTMHPMKPPQDTYILTHELNSIELNYASAITKLEYILNILLKFDIKIVKNIEHKFKVYDIDAYDTTWLNFRRRKREMIKKSQPQCDNEINSTVELAVAPEPKRLKLEQSDVVLKCSVSLRNKLAKNKIILELSYTAGTTGKNGLHQLMLFISNRFKENISCE